ncbi:S-layer glycoprotein N-glycosyltransferase AglJ [Methanocorpusculum vombati]|uniref:S-layer glycoprotein N-glycosyltransferase AglJ n=1 Tax=Methanocorpusculum vombati TaxID=3002864 RepID=A0ABT4IKT3_9EURY|nr:S-layer glycoprotein N-glycosyltransferase AglJ [Methanocorpusculum vombati]MCZ9320030.1 S-layer glycoprotein N-glycosyltransferase AglJ [Methanocorpusculum sp.]MCZ0861949.1 S-layer glycoprotein N-glycosyltransferase AglJ [Methanocorpusculum vombati]MDE2520069.1 S-layer glycoprotein N-glycosyltransferase AglJ [Methanocorpusculum sp.]MDE2535264.1 S-layer glycoprotein N-glycosyltransferase AglJ [Methanocorpusculum sp.]MDE2547853.1 S-layer glycoprotein N-glycosyltransferase AglJ [Methanocorpus
MDFSKDDVCVLIPTLNEKATIGSVIEELQAEGYHQILVVDGHSTDGTPEIAEKLGATVMTQKGKGKGAAMIEAFETITAPYILMLDGDGTNPPEYADAMMEPLVRGRADHVIGNRLNQYERGALTRLNLWGNRLMNTLFKWAHGVYMTDILSGYRAFTLDSVRQMNLKEAGFEIETEISSAVIHRGLRFEVVPTYYKKRPGSPTKLHPIRDGYKILRAINKYGKMNNPLFHFSVIGVLMGIAGFCLGLYVLFEWLAGIEHLFMGILTMLLIITGILTFMIGFISDMILGYHRELMREMRILRTKLEEIEKNE